jgi:hypothetical protein
MRLESLPFDQNRYNRRHNGYLGALSTTATIVLLIGFAIGVGLYLYPPSSPDEFSNVSRGDITCPAVVIAPTLVLCDAKLPGAVVFTSGKEISIQGNAIRTERVTDQTEMTLVRLQSDAPVASLRQPSAAIPGERYTASANHQQWEGTLLEAAPQTWMSTQPSFQLGGGIAVLSPADGSLVGISANSSTGAVVVPMQELVRKFPEISSGR